MKTKSKNNQGITLIALIITIVVMLILVAVTITTVMQSNLIGNTEKAAQGWKDAQVAEANLSKITIGEKEYNSLSEIMQEYCNHTWGEWIVTKEATYSENGSRNRECTKCGIKQTEEIGMTVCEAHTLGSWTTTRAATCIAEGEKTATCGVCHAIVREGIAIDTVNGHNYSNGKCEYCSRCQIDYSGLANVTKTSGAETLAANETETIVIAANSGYELPDTVTVSGATLQSYTKETGTIVITNPTGQVTITVEGKVEVSPYIGCYAYVNGTYGIIFADLAYPKSGTGLKRDYSYPGTNDATSGFKSYHIMSGGQKTDDFGTKDVIAVDSNATGNDRFYVMALDDLDSESHYWYYSARSNTMPDYASVTSENFGEGKTNTANMKAKWNSGLYGVGNPSGVSYSDMWGLTFPSGWFVPSILEWFAFAGELGISSNTNGLSDSYWSSSQYSDDDAWVPGFSHGRVFVEYTDKDRCVRLCTTF